MDVLKLQCPDCNSEMILRSGRFGYFYGCSNFPTCRCVHSAHQNTLKPMGIPGDQKTRELRAKAHRFFDMLWKKPYGIMCRSDAYLFLSKLMGIGIDDAHIGKFSYEQCQILIDRITRSGVLGKNFELI